jgi:hypothetical protein
VRMMHAVMNNVEFIQIESERCPYSLLSTYTTCSGVDKLDSIDHTSSTALELKSTTPVQYDGPIKKCTGPPPPSALGFPE